MVDCRTLLRALNCAIFFNFIFMLLGEGLRQNLETEHGHCYGHLQSDLREVEGWPVAPMPRTAGVVKETLAALTVLLGGASRQVDRQWIKKSLQ
jgi:hypothetical protein